MPGHETLNIDEARMKDHCMSFKALFGLLALGIAFAANPQAIHGPRHCCIGVRPA